MTSLLRSLLLLALGSALLVGCGEKAEEAAVEETPAAAAPAAEAAPAAAPTSAGGYEPTAEERVPGITIDPAQLATEGAAPAEAAPAEAAPAAK